MFRRQLGRMFITPSGLFISNAVVNIMALKDLILTPESLVSKIMAKPSSEVRADLGPSRLRRMFLT